MKIYKDKTINECYENGELTKSEGKIIFKIETKPNGSSSNFLSVGKFVAKKDEFGDMTYEWHHQEYPNKFEFDGFKCKKEYYGKGSQQKISWTFIIPETFLKANLGIAIIGSGKGGRGYSNTDIDIVVDKDRLRHI